MKNLPKGMIQKVVFALLFITGAILYAQDKTYASDQSYLTDGVCVGCSVINPQNATGSDETNFATIKIPLSLLGGKVEQTLIFPAATTRHFKKIVIGIGSPSQVLSAKLLGGEAYVESYSGTTPNGDKTLINNNMLELAQDQKKGTIEFTPKKFFDRIKITLNGGAVGLNDALQIYYAYHKSIGTTCNTPPFEPLLHFPFDGSVIESDNIINFIPPSVNDPHPIIYKDGLVCGKAITSPPNTSTIIFNRLKLDPNGGYGFPEFFGPKTISFWARVEDSGYLEIMPFLFKIHITPTQAQVVPNLNPVIYTNNAPGQLNHYTIVYDYNRDPDTNEPEKGIVCMYKNGVKISNVPGELYCKSEINIDETPGLIIQLKDAFIDDLLYYDKALTADEVKTLLCSYYSNSQECPLSGTSSNGTISKTSPTSKITAPTETFTVSPNPTTGEITLDGNILLVGSDISIRNTSGTEVYHSAFRSRTFELPATLPGGVYMLTLQTKDKKVYTRKIILTR
ncbi:T9SS type A sorting domain-containing protein [Chryseobacterium sp. NRRL B-14859]|uniref:T9SS type A sorting domain-containing protein n=1 Tax=Chryseobacterium sp. NRRL B-14859 TaxID=1562763 RepID=UPI003397ADA0